MKTKRIKILFTTSNFHTAGSGKVIYDLVKGLDKQKFDIAIACGSNKGAFFKEVETLGVPIHVFETKTPYRPYTTLLPRVWKIAKFYKQHEFDIVHSWQWSSDWTEALAAKIAGVKWMYTKKAMGANNKHWKIKSYLANFIVTINDEMRAYFPTKKQQTLIPIGIDTSYYNPTLFKNIKKKEAIFNIITVANLVPVKGVEVLIEAVSLLNDKHVTLTIVGDCDNAYGEELRAFTNTLGIENQVRFLGKKLDVRPYIVASDLYVIPTLNEGRKEGMPMALVEAMSMQIPVLGSDITGINFVLKAFNHLLFKAGDTKALASKINMIKTMDESSRKHLAHDLRTYCETHFTMKSFINKHEFLYKKLLKK
ncbi:glycosyltransferase family 4 protein [Corallibacter sp.]|uniref:glycosyltransferase family 4 protein n=1 Tax=Corallibacter sp. TaxID=2038084 RepID=UPI003AB4F85A